ncbi:hypothetical protein EE612_011368 [Oryza sativa]|nr:hypothetical protein EE612_011368 [Oryza sativa]
MAGAEGYQMEAAVLAAPVVKDREVLRLRRDAAGRRDVTGLVRTIVAAAPPPDSTTRAAAAGAFNVLDLGEVARLFAACVPTTPSSATPTRRCSARSRGSAPASTAPAAPRWRPCWRSASRPTASSTRTSASWSPTWSTRPASASTSPPSTPRRRSARSSAATRGAGCCYGSRPPTATMAAAPC